MQVQNSTISLFSASEYTKNTRHNKKLNIWNHNLPQTHAKKLNSTPSIKKIDTKLSQESTSIDPKLQTLKLILEALTGKKIHITTTGELETKHDQGNIVIAPSTLNADNAATPEMVGWGIDYQETMSVYEAEQTTIMASGIVNTKDGRSINFAVNLTMKREFQTSSSFSFKAGDALIDPLVINFNGNAADLIDTKFKFDINYDGKDEDLAWLKNTSGFLVFDKNKNGIVDNGTELFGPETGNGFNELSELDSDKNGFIDENDPDFINLMIWSGKTREESQLMTLEYHGIGAIGLINVKTEFSVNDGANNTLGKIQRTGIYIKANGQAGTIQQLDLSV